MFKENIFIFLLVIGYCSSNPQPIVVAFGDSTAKSILPYMVAVERNNDPMCGGSLIRPVVVLTAAHCLMDENLEKLKIRAGSLHKGKGGQTRQIKQYTNHPRFNGTKKDDVAVVQLMTPFNIDDSVKPIKLATGTIPTYTKALMSGWGQLGPIGKYPDVLQSVQLQVWPDNFCRVATKQNDFNSICAGFGGNDACIGDSGGPLVANDTQIGIMSYGFRFCGYPIVPSVYINVSAYNSWIEVTANTYEVNLF